MFWVGFGLDYLPVLMGASEMPAMPRGVLLAATGIVLARISLSLDWPAGVCAAQRSQPGAACWSGDFGKFDDSLVTAVEMADLPDHASAFSRELLARTTDEARARPTTCGICGSSTPASLGQKLVAAAAGCWSR